MIEHIVIKLGSSPSIEEINSIRYFWSTLTDSMPFLSPINFLYFRLFITYKSSVLFAAFNLSIVFLYFFIIAFGKLCFLFFAFHKVVASILARKLFSFNKDTKILPKKFTNKVNFYIKYF